MHILVSLKVLFLVTLANGTQVIAKNILGNRFAFPIDGGANFVDGHPMLGLSKTFRGIFISILVTSAFAPTVRMDWKTGALAASTAMTGDLFSSFLKRRLNLPAGGRSTGLDQLLESLFPLLACRSVLMLTALDIVANARSTISRSALRLETCDSLGLVRMNIENRVKLGDLQKFGDFLTEVQQFQFPALAFHGLIPAHQFAKSEAIHVICSGQINEDLRLSIAEFLPDSIAQCRASFAEGDAPIQIQHGYAAYLATGHLETYRKPFFSPMNLLHVGESLFNFGQTSMTKYQFAFGGSKPHLMPPGNSNENFLGFSTAFQSDEPRHVAIVR
jgi:CDP-2,3-bis-(O-geranylgeranyl)-sn-glycerol synthase